MHSCHLQSKVRQFCSGCFHNGARVTHCNCTADKRHCHGHGQGTCMYVCVYVCVRQPTHPYHLPTTTEYAQQFMFVIRTIAHTRIFAHMTRLLITSSFRGTASNQVAIHEMCQLRLTRRCLCQTSCWTLMHLAMPTRRGSSQHPLPTYPTVGLV